MTITISEQAKAIVALETERQDLYAKARNITIDQEQATRDYKELMARMSNHHRNILTKLSALDDALFYMLRSL